MSKTRQQGLSIESPRAVSFLWVGFPCPPLRVTEATPILLSDIDSTYTVAVIFQTAFASVVSVCRVLSITTFWASLRSVGFVDDGYFNTECFCLVGDQLGDFTKRPLVEFLIRTFAIVDIFSDTCDVSKNNPLAKNVRFRIYQAISRYYIPNLKDWDVVAEDLIKTIYETPSVKYNLNLSKEEGKIRRCKKNNEKED